MSNPVTGDRAAVPCAAVCSGSDKINTLLS